MSSENSETDPNKETPAPTKHPDNVKRIRGGGVKQTVKTIASNLSPYTQPEREKGEFADVPVYKSENGNEDNNYPHGTHPALVPGIGIDEQRKKYSLNRIIFTIAGLLTAAFVVWGVSDPDSVADISGTFFTWTMNNFGWLFAACATVILVFMIAIACTKYGKIPLGKDGEKPEYSTFAWVAMLFAAGLGVGVFFFGPSEPFSFFLNPPPHTSEAESVEALHNGLAQAYFHWGFHAWAIYALIGSAIAYVAYRRGRVPLLSSVFRKVFGEKHSEGLAGYMVDIFAIIATLFGTAASLGLAAIQIAEGTNIVFGVEVNNPLIVMIIALLACGFITSAISGVSRGIRYLSSANIVLTMGVVLTIFILGPTLFLLNLIPTAAITYVENMMTMSSLQFGSWGAEAIEFQSAWTVFFWAWWISWSPFVGVFIARISRGRTLRQVIFGVITIPTTLLIVCFGILGGTAIEMYRNGEAGFHDAMTEEEVLFGIIDNLPVVDVFLPALVLIILAIFFITAADSASVIMGIMSTRGNLEPKKYIVIFWGLLMAGVSTVMILTGGDVALSGLQNLLTVTALPFTAVLVLIMIGFVRELRTDPLIIREHYAEQAIKDAVVEGVDTHGDDFQLSVKPTAAGEGAGRHLDTEVEEYTEWYQRTDEEGNPVEYDYSTGTWEDGYDPETGTISVVEANENIANIDNDISDKPKDTGEK